MDPATFDIGAAFGYLFSGPILALAGGVWFLMKLVAVALGDELKDHPVVNRLLVLAPFVLCAAIAILVPDAVPGDSIGARVPLGLWCGGLSVLFHVVLAKLILGDKKARSLDAALRRLVKK